jgi:hypothetical protein
MGRKRKTPPDRPVTGRRPKDGSTEGQQRKRVR